MRVLVHLGDSFAEQITAACPGVDAIVIPTADAIDRGLPEGHWMYTHPRVHVSAHVSWNGPGGEDVLVGKFIENLRRRLRGEPLEGVVDVAAGY